MYRVHGKLQLTLDSLLRWPSCTKGAFIDSVIQMDACRAYSFCSEAVPTKPWKFLLMRKVKILCWRENPIHRNIVFRDDMLKVIHVFINGITQSIHTFDDKVHIHPHEDFKKKILPNKMSENIGGLYCHENNNKPHVVWLRRRPRFRSA